MPRKNKTASDIRPCISTQEVLRLSNTSESTLRSYVRDGVATPHDETGSGYKRWTFEQAVDLSLIRHMRTYGVALDEVASHARDGRSTLLDEAYYASMRSIRENRRALKAIVHLRGSEARSAKVGIRDGYYLRYFPQRWCAMMPVAEDAGGLLGMDDYVHARCALDEIVSVVGWSPTYESGTITSLAADAMRSTTYVFEELASPPMPATTGMMIVDGGCYECVCPGQAPGCDTNECPSCSRFGRLPSLPELTSWSDAEANGTVIDRTVLPSRLDAPYPAGFWACSSHIGDDGRFGTAVESGKGPSAGERDKTGKDTDEPRRDGPGRSGRRIPDSPSVVPRLMPQNCQLPLGTTACVLPAGVYLCAQNEFGNRDLAFNRVVGVASTMKRLEMTPEIEVERSRHLADLVAAAGAGGGLPNPPGPYIEPFASPRGFNGDPAFEGFLLDLDESEVSELTLPVNTALAPEDGFVIAHTNMSSGPNPERLRQEFQLLVDASEYLAARA